MFDILVGMDRQIKRHLERRGIGFAHGRPEMGLLGTRGGMAEFLRWFHEDVMRFDSIEYRRRFWREAYRNAHTIGDMPRTWIEFTDPRRHRYNAWVINLAVLMAAMGVSAVVWCLVRTVDAHIRRLRRPTYYEAERARRLALAAERRRIGGRSTLSPCPGADALRAAFACARSSTASMVRFGSLLEDLECYVDNSVVWSEAEGRIVGRRGGIRQWLNENAPDLALRYKTLMRYKALSRKFRQAVGISDPAPASAVLPPEGDHEPRDRDRRAGRGEGGHEPRNAKAPLREHSSERILGRKVAEQSRQAARELLAACEGTVASLSARLALMVSVDFVPNENTARTNSRGIVGIGRKGSGLGRSGTMGSGRKDSVRKESVRR